jgi:hypothetical protein
MQHIFIHMGVSIAKRVNATRQINKDLVGNGTHQDSKDGPRHQRAELRHQRQHLRPVGTVVFVWASGDVEAKTNDREERYKEDGGDRIEQQEDCHEQRLANHDHHLPVVVALLELVSDESKFAEPRTVGLVRAN